jgi:hypothetical protein
VISDHENEINRVKDEIVQCYELVQPHLLKMRVLKQSLKKIEEKLDPKEREKLRYRFCFS